MTRRIWQLHEGDGPLVATALHSGHRVREEVLRHLALDEGDRLRKEDLYTERWTKVAPTRIVGLHSRFEVDLNRPRERAVYRGPEDAWGLHVWKRPLPKEVVERSLAQYDAFYRRLCALYAQLAEHHTQFVVFDLHAYNHRLRGPEGPPSDPEVRPQVNVGTGTMKDRRRWAGVIERFMSDLAAFDFPGGNLDVRENVKFSGGHCAAWTHATFPDSGCVLSIEVKKFYMDEWSGEADLSRVEAIGRALESTVPGVLEELANA